MDEIDVIRLQTSACKLQSTFFIGIHNLLKLHPCLCNTSQWEHICPSFTIPQGYLVKLVLRQLLHRSLPCLTSLICGGYGDVFEDQWCANMNERRYVFTVT